MESAGLYMTTFPTGEQFTWRLLTLKEYRIFRGLREAATLAPLTLYEEVFNHCYLGNADAVNGNLPAGYFPAMGELIMWLSGDSSTQKEREEIETARLNYPTNSVQETMKRIVLLAFAAYTPDDIETWSHVELLRKFTIAEAVLVNRGGYELLDTKQIMSQEQASKKKVNPIDFDKENREYSSAMGDANKPHILDQHPDALAMKQAKSRKLEKVLAQQLEKSIQRGR